MQQLIAIALGGAIGAVMRFLVANGIYAILGRSFPHGTLFVNVLGSLLMGFLTEVLVFRFAVSVEYRAAILVGFLGAFTTFSTFALETLYLFEEGNLLKAFLNIFLSAVLCLTACWMGLIWGRVVFSGEITPWLSHHLPAFELLLTFFAVFTLSILVELFINHYRLTTEMRAIFFVSLLGILTIVSTLWFGFKGSELQLEFHRLLSLFIINTLFGVVMIWSGSWIGNWLWQLKQSL
ncbi:MAG: fluoride efflux transporter CrcB [Gammaproteobacteria bacterium]